MIFAILDRGLNFENMYPHPPTAVLRISTIYQISLVRLISAIRQWISRGWRISARHLVYDRYPLDGGYQTDRWRISNRWRIFNRWRISNRCRVSNFSLPFFLAGPALTSDVECSPSSDPKYLEFWAAVEKHWSWDVSAKH